MFRRSDHLKGALPWPAPLNPIPVSPIPLFLFSSLPNILIFYILWLLYFILFVVCFLLLQEGIDFCLCCSLLSPHCPKQCLAHSRLINRWVLQALGVAPWWEHRGRKWDGNADVMELGFGRREDVGGKQAPWEQSLPNRHQTSSASGTQPRLQQPLGNALD